ncbi:MAG: hypothetical protein HZB70_01160 [Candidatus Berkelbacteria bacterium]|nr:MAG: hypothetical protein HZB70_01160 [Candidatus Berkelbacteria bacterium]QQG52052.1 MAG: hypothetical protein HY845_01835 [Candidatus Berkelbacteria bacterium]
MREAHRWADMQAIPAGDWLVQLNIFTNIGCQKHEHQVRGEFRRLIPFIGIRSPEEVERIRQMVADASEGGYDWVTLYNPPGLPKQFEHQATSTITIRYSPLEAPS